MLEKQPSTTEKQLLFVDDDKSLALLGADLLTDFGYSVTCAFDGKEALQLFQQPELDFNLVITDESMPGISGIELAQQIYLISPKTPVIICSGHLLTMHEAGMAATNITAVLAKTAVCSELPVLLEKLLLVK